MNPGFYSKAAIGLLALLISPLLACILFAYNLREVGEGKTGPAFIIGGIFLLVMVVRVIDIHVAFQLAIVNIIGSALLYFYFWDKFLDGCPVYEKRNFWAPTLFFLFIIITVIIAQILVKNR